MGTFARGHNVVFLANRESPRLARSAFPPRDAVIPIKLSEVLREFITQGELAGRLVPLSIDEPASLHFEGKRSRPRHEFTRLCGNTVQQSDGAPDLGCDFKLALGLPINHVDFCL